MDDNRELYVDFLAEFVNAYLTAALWTSVDDRDEPLDSNYDIGDINFRAMLKSNKDCGNFFYKNYMTLIHTPDTYTAGDAGHDFWLTRNGHGAGFWDGDAGNVGDTLTEATKEYKEINLIVGDNGELYFE